jgi:hypothetical protein
MGLTFNIGGQVELDADADWSAQKMAYGRQVAITVADGVVPQLAAQFGSERLSPVNGRLTGRNSLHNVSGTKMVGGHVLIVREKISGTFRFQGDCEMSVGDIVFTARDLIAMAVAESVLFALEHRLEGKQASDTSMELDRENGEVVAFERTEQPKKPRGRAL